MKQRLLYIDNLKGFLILLVVLGHCIQSTTDDFDHNVVIRYIYAFHMPLFMAVSGFVSYRPEMGWQTVGRRFEQLIVPFGAWTCLDCCIYLAPERLAETILHPDRGLWFLWALFFIIVTLKLCVIAGRRFGIRIEWGAAAMTLLLVGVMVVLKFKLFGFQFIAWYFPFYCMGFFGRKYYDRLQPVLHKAVWPLLAMFLVLAYWWMREEVPTFMPTGSSVIYNYAYKFLVATVAIAAFIPVFQQCLNLRLLMFTKLGGRRLAFTPHISRSSMLLCGW